MFKELIKKKKSDINEESSSDSCNYKGIANNGSRLYVSRHIVYIRNRVVFMIQDQLPPWSIIHDVALDAILNLQ